MHELQHFRECGSFATAALPHLPLLSNDAVLASLGQDYPGWEVKRVLSRTTRFVVILFQKTDQPVEYLCHEIPGGYANLGRFISSESVRDTIFNGLWSKFAGLNTFADQGWRVVDVVDTGVLLILFKRPVQEEAGQAEADQ